MRVAMEGANNRPFEYLENKKWTGYHVELIENVAKELRWRVEWTPIPWPKAYNILYTGEVDAISFLMKTPFRPEPNILFLDGNVINHFKVFLYSRMDPPIKTKIIKNNIGMLAKYQVGVVAGGIADRWISILHPEVILNRSAQDSSQLFELLDKKRFDFVLAVSYSYDVAVSNNPNLKNLIQVHSSPLLAAPAYLAFGTSKSTVKMAEDFANALTSYKKTRAYEDLRTKYQMK